MPELRHEDQSTLSGRRDLPAGLWVLMWFVFGTTVALIFGLPSRICCSYSFIDLDVATTERVGWPARGHRPLGVVVFRRRACLPVPPLAGTGSLEPERSPVWVC
jgi:hypothetical protein